MNRKAEPHNLPSCPVAAELWNNKTSNWTSSNGKGEDVPIQNGYCLIDEVPQYNYTVNPHD